MLERRWAKESLAMAGALALAIGLAALVYYSEAYGLLAWGIAGLGIMITQFLLGLWLIRLVLAPGHPITGVARTLVDEAIRMKVALVLIGVVLVIVPFLPVMLDINERLTYRIGTFITYSMIVTSMMLSVMTIFLACGTITRELRDRQIFLSLTKPVGRGQYLVGKWLGIVLLNGLLLSVAGTGIYGFSHALEMYGRPLDERDGEAVRTEVLTARVAAVPLLPPDFNQAVTEGLTQLIEEHGDAFAGSALEPRATLQQVRERVRQRLLAEWHAIPPNNIREYRFIGLDRVRDRGGSLQLRIKPRSSHAEADGMVRVNMRINGRFPPMQEGQPVGSVRIANDTYYRLSIPADLIDAEGNLVIAVLNGDPTGQRRIDGVLQFEPGEGFELLYEAGGFGANLGKGLVVLWLRLSCLAMLGLAAGTFLGFPIASLLVLLIYITAASSGFITEALFWYGSFQYAEDVTTWQQMLLTVNELIARITAGEIGPLVQFLIRMVASGFMALVPSFGELDPVGSIADGRVVPGAMVRDAVIYPGLLWTAAAGVVGYAIFRRRELARVIV